MINVRKGQTLEYQRGYGDAKKIYERKKGMWFLTDTMYACNQCHSVFYETSPFCPTCGADMRGEQDDWNLCVDRLPEKEGRYLITVDEDGRKDVSDDFFYFRGDGTPSWNIEKNVIAWMPLPEPYRGEKDD